MIRNIVFDMGGVLVYYDPPHFIDLLCLEEDRDLLMKKVFNTVAWAQSDRGIITEEDALAAIQRDLPPRLHGAAERLLFWWDLELRPMEGIEELLRELKELGYPLYLLSNASLRQPQYFDRIPGSQYFDGRVVSSAYKLLKPQPELYQILLQKYDLKAEECFFVDDFNLNIEAAVLLGMSGTVFRGAADLRRELIRAGVPVRPPEAAEQSRLEGIL